MPLIVTLWVVSLISVPSCRYYGHVPLPHVHKYYCLLTAWSHRKTLPHYEALLIFRCNFSHTNYNRHPNSSSRGAIHGLYVLSSNTETKMSSFWWNFHHWLHWKLSKWQLPVQPMMKISSKWRHFRFSEGLTHIQSQALASCIQLAFYHKRTCAFQGFCMCACFICRKGN